MTSRIRFIMGGILSILVLSSVIAVYVEGNSVDELQLYFQQTYRQVYNAERAGGSISPLVQRLNQALHLIQSGKDSDLQTAKGIMEEVGVSALEVSSIGSQSRTFSYLIFSITLVTLGSTTILILLYGSRFFRYVRYRTGRLESRSTQIDEGLKVVTLVCLVILIASTIYPVFTNSFVEPFSELGLIGRTGNLGDFPRSVRVGEPVNLFIYVGNEEGKVEYYRVYVKLGSQNKTVSDTIPLDAPILTYYDVVLMNGQNVTIPTTLSIPQAGVNISLVFEMNIYDYVSSGFIYYHRSTQLWLNATKTT